MAKEFGKAKLYVPAQSDVPVMTKEASELVPYRILSMVSSLDIDFSMVIV